MYKPIDMESLKLNNNFKWVITKDDFFTKEECNYIIDKVNKNSERKKTKYYEKEDIAAAALLKSVSNKCYKILKKNNYYVCQVKPL